MIGNKNVCKIDIIKNYNPCSFFRRSKITWGHKILSFKQCGVVDAPHCFEAS